MLRVSVPTVGMDECLYASSQSVAPYLHPKMTGCNFILLVGQCYANKIQRLSDDLIGGVWAQPNVALVDSVIVDVGVVSAPQSDPILKSSVTPALQPFHCHEFR